MKRLLLVTAVIALLCVGVAASAALVFDRGLPTANLNDAAGSLRSNVAWADSDYATGWFIGDNFQIAGTGQTAVSDLTVWVVGDDVYNTFTLWTGSSDVSATRTSSIGDANLAFSSVTYSGGSTYQGNSGAMRNIYELTFKNLAWTVDNGTAYRFGVSSKDSSGNSLAVYLHSSNAGLSVSTQEGADGKVYGFDNGAYNYTYDSGVDGGWDKSSDVNVRINGTQVPEPMSIMLGIMGLGSVAGFRKLRRR